MSKAKSAITMTARWLERLQLPTEGRIEVFDDNVHGLGIRVSATGHRSWFLLYRVRGNPRLRRITLGSYPQLTIPDARDAARAILNQAHAGEDPATEKQALKSAPTIAWLAHEYLERYAKPRKRSWEKDWKILRADVIPAWGARKLHEVRRKDVLSMLDAVVDRGAPIHANRVLACIRKMFNWAISRDLMDVNPCSQVKAPSPENHRDRVLNERELQEVWSALTNAPCLSACAIKLRLLTAQRGGEVDTMRWQDVDLSSGWWTIPAERAKNKLSHRVPLAPAVLAILRDLQAACGEARWVFPSPYRKDRPIQSVRDAADDIRKAIGIDFVPHDLRRTAASYMTSLGVPRLVVGKILNHVEQGITRVYDRHSYDREKRLALELWADALTAIVEGRTIASPETLQLDPRATSWPVSPFGGWRA